MVATIFFIISPQLYLKKSNCSVFYTSSSNPFGGVVFAYTKTHIRIWIPKRGNGASPANGISFGRDVWVLTYKLHTRGRLV
jgi:hypothetical protein